MGPLIGFVSIPRPAEALRLAGAFFSAAVEAQVGTQTWRVKLGGQSLIVTTSIDLTVGQTLRLKLASQQGDRWILQILPQVSTESTKSSAVEGTALMAAFLSRGLPLATEKLSAWTRWLAAGGPSDRESWAASLESKGRGPNDPVTAGLAPWFSWLKSIEEGNRPPPPEDDYWDLWNSLKPSAGDPWLVTTVRWVHQDQQDAGLLQAHWSPQAQAIDQWNFTAAPAETPFRLEARIKPRLLDLTWRFFRETDRQRWELLIAPLEASLSSAETPVRLQVAGRPGGTDGFPLGGIDVRI